MSRLTELSRLSEFSRITELFGRKNADEPANDPPIPLQPGQGESHPSDKGARLDGDNIAELGAQLGQENEALRSLLVDTARKISDLDSLKDTFARVAEPIFKTLRALEQERTHNLSLRGHLGEARAAHEKLQTEFYAMGKAASALQSEHEQVKADLDLAQQSIRSQEATRAELAADVAGKRTQIADFERQLAEEIAHKQHSAEDHRSTGERATAAEKRVTQLDAECAASREKLVLLQDENRSLHTSLEQTLAESSRFSRKLTEAENGLTAARARIVQLETSVAEGETERNRLTTSVEETAERYRAENGMLNMRLESLQTRVATAEKLLTDAREALSARAVEVRDLTRQVSDAAAARATLEKSTRDLQAGKETQDRQMKELDQSRAALVERSNALSKTLKSRESLISRADEKMQVLTDRIAHLESDLKASQGGVEKRIAELNAELQRERMDRAVAEGALEASRKDYARLHRESVLLDLERTATAQNGRGPKAAEPIIGS